MSVTVLQVRLFPYALDPIIGDRNEVRAPTSQPGKEMTDEPASSSTFSQRAGFGTIGSAVPYMRLLQDAENWLTEPPDAATVYDAMRLTPPILVVLCVAALTGCNPGSSATAIAGDDDLNVLRAVVNSTCTSEYKEVVSDLPLAPFLEMQSDQGGAIASFGSRFGSPREVRWPRGAICAKVRVVDNAVIEEVLSHETSIPPRWTFFRERFDDARKLMRVSLPAYSADGRIAVVYAEGTCPYSCGTGVVYELHDTDSKWTIVRSKVTSRP